MAVLHTRQSVAMVDPAVAAVVTAMLPVVQLRQQAKAITAVLRRRTVVHLEQAAVAVLMQSVALELTAQAVLAVMVYQPRSLDHR